MAYSEDTRKKKIILDTAAKYGALVLWFRRIIQKVRLLKFVAVNTEDNRQHSAF